LQQATGLALAYADNPAVEKEFNSFDAYIQNATNDLNGLKGVLPLNQIRHATSQIEGYTRNVFDILAKYSSANAKLQPLANQALTITAEIVASGLKANQLSVDRVVGIVSFLSGDAYTNAKNLVSTIAPPSVVNDLATQEHAAEASLDAAAKQAGNSPELQPLLQAATQAENRFHERVDQFNATGQGYNLLTFNINIVTGVLNEAKAELAKLRSLLPIPGV
jgi:hypothetical protein